MSKRLDAAYTSTLLKELQEAVDNALIDQVMKHVGVVGGEAMGFYIYLVLLKHARGYMDTVIAPSYLSMLNKLEELGVMEDVESPDFQARLEKRKRELGLEDHPAKGAKNSPSVYDDVPQVEVEEGAPLEPPACETEGVMGL